MKIQVVPTTEADIPRHSAITTAAFGYEGGLGRAFFPNGTTAADDEHTHNRHLAALRASQDPASPKVFMKAVDAETGAMLGTSRWEIHDAERSEAELQAEDEESANETLPPSANAELMSAFFASLTASRRRIWGGKPHVVLELLCVDPEHHRKGVGAEVLKWGCAKADELGLPAYLESSPQGKGLYAKWGFEEAGPLDFDARDYGSSFNVPHTLMIRPAKKA